MTQTALKSTGGIKLAKPDTRVREAAILHVDNTVHTCLSLTYTLISQIKIKKTKAVVKLLEYKDYRHLLIKL